VHARVDSALLLCQSLWLGLFGPARVSSFISSFRGHSVSLCFEFIRKLFCTLPAGSHRASQVSLQVSKDVLSEFISSLFQHSCLLITQESTNQVKFSAADDFLSPSTKFLPGVPPEGVSVARDEGVGRVSVGGYASVPDCYSPTPASVPHPLLPTSCSRKGVICEDVAEQRVAECCGDFLDTTLPHLSPSVTPPTHFYMRLF